MAMADTLLRELSNADLDWMITGGQRQRLPAGQLLLAPQVVQDTLYVLIEGRLGLSFSANGQMAGAAAGSVDELTAGEVIGTGALFNQAEIAAVTTLEPSLLLTLSAAKVRQKLLDDVAFAAHFYRAIAVMLSNRLRRLFEHPDRLRFWQEGAAKEVLSVFGELRDSDVDWLVSFGYTETVAADRVLLQAGRPVDALYILLDGQLAISAPQGNLNPLYLCFSGLESSTRDQVTLATLSKGSMPGIISFVDLRPLPVTIRATQTSLVFAVPRQTLVTKLQVDDSFACRFYRVIALEILALLQAGGHRLGGAERVSQAEADEELALDDLQQMSEGAQKFNWMLAQLGVVHHG